MRSAFINTAQNARPATAAATLLGLAASGLAIEAPLNERQSFLENGKCNFRFEKGRARAEIRGKCDSATIEGAFETFIPGQGGNTGKSSGTVTRVGGGGAKSAAAGQWPLAKLTCAFSRTASSPPCSARPHSTAWRTPTCAA